MRLPIKCKFCKSNFSKTEDGIDHILESHPQEIIIKFFDRLDKDEQKQIDNNELKTICDLMIEESQKGVIHNPITNTDYEVKKVSSKHGTKGQITGIWDKKSTKG